MNTRSSDAASLRQSGLLKYLHTTRNLFTSLVLIVPVFVIYQAGVIYQLANSPGGSYTINGADYLTASFLRLCNGSLPIYVTFVTMLAVAFAFALNRLSRTGDSNPRVMLPLIGESTVYALLFASTIHLIQSVPLLLTVASNLAAVAGPETWWEMTFQSFGAGFNEELIFRLGMIGGILILGRSIRIPRLWVIVVAFLVSSLSFSAFHYVGPYAETFAFDSFMYRFLAGILLATIFWWRGLAVAVYTHAFYDLYFFFALS